MSNVNNLNVRLSKLSQELPVLRRQGLDLEELYKLAGESESEHAYSVWQDKLDEIDDLEAEIEELEKEIDVLESEHDERDER